MQTIETTKEILDLLERIGRLSVADQLYLLARAADRMRKTHFFDHEAAERSLNELVNSPLMRGEEIPYPVPEQYAPR